MCRIKYGASVCNIQDLKNLVLGIILRQESVFRKEDILNLTLQYLLGSELVIKEKEITFLINSILKKLFFYDILTCNSGEYKLEKIEKGFINQ